MSDIFGAFFRRPLEAASVQEDSSHLNDTHAAEEEVDGREPAIVSRGRPQRMNVRMHLQQITRLDDEAPSGPDGARGHQSDVLSQRELLCGTLEVGDTGENERPLDILSIVVFLRFV